MRFGIDFRLLAAGGAIVHRGMGRFTQQQLREVLRRPAAADHEFVLLVPPAYDPAGLLPEVAGAPNIRQVRVDIPSAGGGPHDDSAVLREAAQLSALCAELRLDLFHSTAPFLPLHTAEPAFPRTAAFWRMDSCAQVATHYDLIPMLFAGEYFSPAEHAHYDRLARALHWADRVLAISHCVADEAARQLGLDRRRMDVAYPIAEDQFRPLTAAAAASALAALGHRLGHALPPDRFLFTVSHLHHAKNLPNLLAAFAAMPADWRHENPLIIGGDFDAACTAALGSWLDALGIRQDAVVPGFLADHELVALYNGCRLFVMASRYEGFGLPALEALHCGAAVVATHGGALPEVLGDAARLVDAEDPASFAAAFDELERHPEARQGLRRAAVARAARFSGSNLGETTLASYLAAIAAYRDGGRRQRPRRPPQPREGRPSRPRLAMWAPLPPLMSGISDYTAELLPELGRHADLELFVDDGYLPDRELLRDWPIYHYTAFERRRAGRPFDAVIYQMGASLYHVFMLEALERWPGIVALHDLTLGYVFLELFRGGWPAEDRGRTLAHHGGSAARDGYAALAATAAAERDARGEAYLGEHFMLDAVIAGSRAAVVHLPHTEALVARYPDARLVSFPMGVEDPLVAEAPHDRAALRRLFQLPEDGFVAGVFGVADPVKRLESVLRAVARLAATEPGALLIVVGHFSSAEYRARLTALAAQLGAAHRLRLFDHVAKGDLYRLLVACDAVVNLRFPFRHQMSATLMRAVAAGKPVAVTELPDWDHLPATFCYSLKPDEHEDANLASWLERLAREPAVAAAMGRAARQHYLQHGTVRQMAERYLGLIGDLTDRPLLEEAASGAAVTSAIAPLASIAASAPIAASGLPACKICEIEDFSDPELAALIRDIFPHEAAVRGADYPHGAEDRKHWEIAMSVRSLARHGALRPDATILGVGAGTEITCFYLTRHAGRVVATDLYLAPGDWREPAALMMTRPQDLCPYPFETWKLAVQHMDGRVLDFPDGCFAGVFSSSSLEHFGGMADIAAAAYEIGRVLAPGGIATLSTEFLLGGPPGSAGWQGVHLFDEGRLRHWIVEASGLELVGEVATGVSAATLATRRDLLETARQIRHGERKLPHLVLSHAGQLFGSVHLTLRKSAGYPVTDNAWARPSAGLRESVAAAAAAAGHRLSELVQGTGAMAAPAAAVAAAAAAVVDPEAAPAPAEPPGRPPAAVSSPAEPAPDMRVPADRLAAEYGDWDAVRRQTALAAASAGPAPARAWGFVRRTLRRVRDLGIANDRLARLMATLGQMATDADRRSAQLAAEIAELRRQMQGLSELNAERHDLLGAVRDVTIRQHTLTARLGALWVRQDSAERALAAHTPDVPPATSAGGASSEAEDRERE